MPIFVKIMQCVSAHFKNLNDTCCNLIQFETSEMISNHQQFLTVKNKIFAGALRNYPYSVLFALHSMC